MSPENIASGLRNMVDDIENLGAGPSTVDTALLRQAIAALTPPEGYVLVPAEPTDYMLREGYGWVDGAGLESAYKAMVASRPEVP